MTAPPPRAAALAAAHALICGARAAAYGPPAESFGRAAAFATLATGIALTPRDIVHVLRAVKQARLAFDPGHVDSLVDLIGYDALLAEVPGGFDATLAALAVSGPERATEGEA